MQSPKKVVIVEDDKFFSRFLRTKIESQLNISIDIIDKSEEFMASLSATHPDLVIMDLVMPKVDGFALLESLQQSAVAKSLPVIVVSNLRQPADVARAKSLGAREYHIKSTTMLDEIVSAIKRNLSI